MARDGEIQNRSLLQRMSDFLDLGGVRRAPNFLNMDDVKAVYVLGQEPVELFSLGKQWPHTLAIDGTTQSIYDITGTTETGASDQLFINSGGPCEIVGLDIQVTYDAAGAIADNTKSMGLQLYRWQRYTSLDPNIVWISNSWQVVATGVLSYRFNLGGYQPQIAGGGVGPVVNPNIQSNYIPTGDRFSVGIFRPGGGVWPANTTIFMSAHFMTPKGASQTPFAFAT